MSQMRFLMSLLLLLLVGVLYGQCRKTFTTNNGLLFDARGNEFLIRGVNNHHAWSGENAYEALTTIADSKTNTVRVVWQTKGSAVELKRIIQRIVDLKMIAIPEIHDATGNDSISALVAAANYWVRDDVKAVLNEFKPYVILNIANEWMKSGNDSIWLSGYLKCLNIIRKAELTHCLLIDAAGFGQNLEPIKQHAATLVNADPECNLLFSVHMYGSWNSNDKIKADLSYLVDRKIPIIVGEYGYNAHNGANNLNCKVDACFLMKTCHQLGVGYLAWSWCGNNAENQWLDMVSTKDWTTLTPWGEIVLNDTYGIMKTAKRCSVFE